MPAFRHDMIPLTPRGERLLDIGGGIGATALELKRLGRCTVAGVVDKIAPLDLGGLDFAYRGDLNEPEFLARVVAEQGRFDTVLCLDVLEHLVDPYAVIAAVYRITSPGGTLVASIPNVRHVSVLAPLLFRGRWNYAESGVLDRTHLRFFTRASAQALISASGFRIERVQPCGTDSRLSRALNWLTLGLLRDLFTMQYFIVARRDV